VSGCRKDRWFPRATVTSGGGDLVTAAALGTVNAFSAVANLVLTSDGVTAGGVWQLTANANISPTANIAVTKLAHGAINTTLQTNALGNIVWAAAGGSALVTTLAPGEVNLLGAANTVMCTDGVTAGGEWRDYLQLPAAGYVSVGLTAGSGAGSVAATGGVRLQGNGAVQGQIVFRNAADTGDIAGMHLRASDTLWFGGAFPVRPNTLQFDAQTNYLFQTLNLTRVSISTIALTLAIPTLQFTFSTVTPEVVHATDTTAAVVGDLFKFHSQSVDSGGAGASTGGALDVYAGDGINADDHGANAYFGGGRNIGAGAGVDGNIGLNARAGDAVNFQAMERGIYLCNAITAPTGNPTGGGFLYALAGALYWRGSGATVTPIAPAGPHCEVCGYDEWRVATLNMEWRSWNFECAHCGAVYQGGPKTVLDRLQGREQEILREDMQWNDIKRVMKVAA